MKRPKPRHLAFVSPKLRLQEESMPASGKELKRGGLGDRVTGRRVEREVSDDDEGLGRAIAIR